MKENILTFAQKEILNRIGQKKRRGVNSALQDYTEHEDYWDYGEATELPKKPNHENERC